MEVIKKKISLECFKSRIPALVEGVFNDERGVNQTNGIWGKIPKNIKHELFTRSLTFEEFSNLYNSLIDVITKASYFEYDDEGSKWIQLDFDWRNIFSRSYPNLLVVSSLPKQGVKNSVYCLTTNKGEITFNEKVSELTNGNVDGKNVIILMNNIIGRDIIPPTAKCNSCGHSKIGYDIKSCEMCNSDNISYEQGINVPYFIYFVDVNETISLLEDLKNKAFNCCNLSIYEEYGGNAFLNYLKNLKENSSWNQKLKRWEIYSNSGDTPTITIPILLTGKNLDLGQYRTYDVDYIEDGNNENTELEENVDFSGTTNVVMTNGESKLRMLRKRKRSFDDDSKEIPGILIKNTDNTYEIKLPYEVGYVKNIKNNGNDIYGDMIVSMVETPTVSEITSSLYDEFSSIDSNKKYCKEGTISKPLFSDVTVFSTKNVGSSTKTLDVATKEVDEDLLKKTISILNSLISYNKGNYPSCLMSKQDYKFTYNLTYKSSSSGKEEKTTIIREGSLYSGVISSYIDITYVLGGKMKKNNGSIVLDSSVEYNPFGMSDGLDLWKGYGIWYKETYPLKKMCIDTFNLGGEIQLSYDEIDFKNKEITYEFDGIDFPRKNYILCENIIYRTMSYKENATHDAVFKDEKMMGINYPLREKYDILIDRGSTAAFEKHIQLTDLKTWEDLENYRNGMFLNK